jgi:hypothetical protein
MNGWIKLHRKFLEWEWYDDTNSVRVFLHLLIKANHKDKNYRGTLIKRGQLVTGRTLLSEQTGLSEQQIRTVLNKLKSTGELTIKSTSKGSLVTLVNYGLYQGDDTQSTSATTSKLTNEQPASNQQSTTNKNVKNEKKLNNAQNASSDDDSKRDEKKAFTEKAWTYFWDKYPKRVDKKKARSKFELILKNKSIETSGALINKIGFNIDRRLDTGDWLRDESHFIPSPAKYLLNELWNDEI